MVFGWLEWFSSLWCFLIGVFGGYVTKGLVSFVLTFRTH